MGVWHVSGVTPVGPAVTGVTPPHSTAARQIFTFTFTDTSRFGDITAADALINDFINGIGACYIAYIPALNAVVLVDNAGDAGGPYAGSFVLGSGGASNSQCSINGATSSANGSANTFNAHAGYHVQSQLCSGQRSFQRKPGHLLRRDRRLGQLRLAGRGDRERAVAYRPCALVAS